MPFTYLVGIMLIVIVISLDPPTGFPILFGACAVSGLIYWLWCRRAVRPRQGHAG